MSVHHDLAPWGSGRYRITEWDRCLYPLHNAASRARGWEIDVLLTRTSDILGASAAQALLSARDPFGNTPLHVLAMSMSKDSGAVVAFAEALLHRGAEPLAVNDDGLTAGAIAESRGMDRLVCVLAAAGIEASLEKAPSAPARHRRL